MVVLLRITAPASRRRAAGGASAAAGARSVAAVPSGHGVALGGDVFLDRHRHAVQRAQRLAAQPARLGGARLCQRGLGAQQPGGVEVRLPALDVRQHGLRHLHRRERRAGGRRDQRVRRAASCSCGHVQRVAAASGPRQRRQVVHKDRHVLPQALDVLVGHGDPLRLVQEARARRRWPSCCCASPSSLARSAARGAFLILSNRSLNLADS